MPLISHDFVCCAIPLYNIGIYSILCETFVVALTTGVLCFATPKIISVSIPGFGPYLLGVLCIFLAVLQLWGFWAVYKEKSRPYRLFVRTSIALTAVSFLLALIWIALSFAHHSSAVDACLEQFVPPGQSITTASGQDLCNTFMWVQCGLLLFMWFFVAFAQTYFLTVQRIYGFEQRRDHAKYNSVYSTLGEEIALRNSIDQQKRGFGGGHDRLDSSNSKLSSLRNEFIPSSRGDPEKTSYASRYQDPFEERSNKRSRRADSDERETRSQMSQYSRSRHQYPPAPGYGGSAPATTRQPRQPQMFNYAQDI